MPISCTWLVEKRVIVQKYYGVVTSKQIADAMDEFRTMMQEGIAPVHVFVDAVEQDGYIDINIRDLPSLVPKILHGAGWIVVVQPNTLQRFFVSLGMQISGARYKFVKDEAAARDYLVKHDPTLDGVLL